MSEFLVNNGQFNANVLSMISKGIMSHKSHCFVHQSLDRDSLWSTQTDSSATIFLQWVMSSVEPWRLSTYTRVQSLMLARDIFLGLPRFLFPLLFVSIVIVNKIRERYVVILYLMGFCLVLLMQSWSDAWWYLTWKVCFIWIVNAIMSQRVIALSIVCALQQ